MMQGDLPPAEADALRAAVSKSPEALAYLERAGSRKSELRFEDVRAGARRGNARKKPEPAAAFRWSRLADFLSMRRGVRGPGFAFAFALAMGVGVWTWSVRPAPMVLAETGRTDNHSIKGNGDAGFRIVIRGAESDTGQLISARNGDTLGLAYRSARPVTAQIWYREEDREVLPMTGTRETLDLDAAMAWRPAGPRIVLEGDWKRQTVWVVWSASPFTFDEAKRALEGTAETALRVASFRMVRQD